MRTGRTVVFLWLAGGLIAACAAAQEKPAGYRDELRLIESQQRRKRYQECVAMCEKMLARFKEAWQVKEVTWLKIENLILDSQYEAALKVLADLSGAYGEDKPLQTAAGLRTGDVQRMLKRFDDAVATYRKLAAGCAKDQPDQAADALLRAGEVLCSDLKKPEKGIAIYRDLESSLGAQEPRRAAEALRRAAAAHESQTKDAAKAADDYLALTAKYASVYDESTLSGLHDKAMD
ncbi:MAG: tetratricopeptide repeat protein, partial [Phycisphaerae bacterium]